MKLLPPVMIAALLVLPGAGWAAAAKLDEPSVRAFVVAQNRAWNARDFARYYATFDPGALIVTIRKDADGRVLRTARSVSDDRKEAERFFASTRAIIRETDRIDKITIAPDGRHARVRVLEETGTVEDGKTSLLHAIAEVELESRDGRIVAVGLTETR